MGKKHKAVEGEIITATGPWRELLLVCRKCGDKLDGGYGPKRKDELPDAFKQVLRDTGRRREVRILEVGCLGVCPKNGVTVMHGARPGEMLVVPEGMDLMQLAGRLIGTPSQAPVSPTEGPGTPADMTP
jgi:predicted metal-binding protein